MKHTRNKRNGMTRHMRILPVFLIAVVALILGASAPVSWASGWGHGDSEEFEVAELYFELNDTDEDLGIHGMIDGGPWKNIWIKDPYYRSMMNVTARGRLRQQAVTELFFESAEPTFDDLEPDDFFDRFPEGDYRIYGWSEEGDLLVSTAEVTHVMPAPPDEIYVSDIPIDPDEVDCDGDPLLVTEPVIISWAPVTVSHPEIGKTGEMIEVVKYQLVVEWEDEDENEWVFSVDLPPDVTSFEVPQDFIDLGDEFKFEILVREASGNQTAAESCFVVE